MAGYSLSKTDPDALVSRQSILLKRLFLSMDARVEPAHDDVVSSRRLVPTRYFFGGEGHGFCGPRRPSNALAMPSTPMSSKRRPMICTPIGKPFTS